MTGAVQKITDVSWHAPCVVPCAGATQYGVRSRFSGGNQIRFGGIDNIAGQYPFAVGQPEDIANVALFLASDESRMVNGAAIPAEGGFSAY